MAANIYEAQSIVKRLSNEQLIESYKNGSLPQFIVFSEMKSRQDMMKSQPQMPTQTVAESMAGSRDEEPVMREPATAARGGQVYSDMPNQMDKFTSLPPALRKMIGNRVPEDSYLSKLIERQTRPDRDYNLARAESYLKDARDSTETFRHGGEVEEPRSPMNGEEFANAHIRGIIMAESGGVHIDPKTGKLLESPAGAKGITQIMDKTARDPGYGIKPKRDDSRDASIDFSKDFLKTAYNLFKDPDQSITAHNTGIFGVQEAVNKAKKYGGHWKKYLPNDESKNYYGKVIGKAQSALPPRQDMAGADTYERPTFAYDNAFLPSGSTANNVGTEKDPDNRGLGAYLIKQALEMRGVPQRKKEGGPIRLQAGSEGEPVPSELWDVNQTTADLERQANERLAEKAQDINFDADPTGINWNSPEVQRVLSYKYPETSSAFGRWWRVPDPDKDARDARAPLAERAEKEYAKKEELKKLQNLKSKLEVGIFTPQTEDDRRISEQSLAEVKQRIKDIKALPPAVAGPVPDQVQTTVSGNPQEAGPLPRQVPEAPAVRPSWAGPDPFGTIDPQPATTNGPQPATTNVPGPVGTPKSGPNTGAGSLAGQLAEIKSLMGNSLSDRSKEVFARDEKILASMQNDKLVNTLMAASAVLAKQRVGSVNYGEAVATAGMAAQEAQGRIVKTEREMNKTRLELAAAQDERDFKAITTAMTRLNHLDTTNTQLQVAVYAANKASSIEDRKDARESQRLTEYDKRSQAAIEARNINSQREKLSTIIANMNTNIRKMKEPGFGATDAQIAEQERILNGYLSQFNSLSPSGGTSPNPTPDLGQAIQNEQNKRKEAGK